MIADSDDSLRLTETIRYSNEKSNRLAIRGHNSKSFITGNTSEEVLRTSDHTGILAYEPNELVVTVRSGTSIAEIRQVLSKHGQMLPFDPPSYNGRGTIGGAIACGLSGPGRPWYGSVRDSVLGIEMVNGLGERLKFGGQVMKNVAGFDLSRLMAGSFGALGLILSASLKVVPEPKTKVTVVADLNESDVAMCYRNILQRTNSVRGTFFREGRMYVLMIDTHSTSAMGTSFEPLSSIDSSFWEDIRDHRLAFFKNARHLSRILLPRGSQIPESMREQSAEEWHGTLVWFTGKDLLSELIPEAQLIDFRGKRGFTLNSGIVKRLHSAFDPNSVFVN